jgi:hypothetical protein
MTDKSISTSNNITLSALSDSRYLIEICTYLGTTVFKDFIKPKDRLIKIKGLNLGKYIIHISNETKYIKK